MNNKGFISKIQHFSLGDGPGIRTTVFMQGCNLCCRWCHNPETITPKSTILCYEAKCTLCGLCAKLCPQRAIAFENGKRIVDKEKCKFCGECEILCPNDAITISGKEMTADAVFEEIMKDHDFYAPSDGGVTFSGGEPLLQSNFVCEMAKLCKERDIHTIIDTAGCVPFENFERVIPFTDIFYFDIKAVNDEDFKRMCGGSFGLVTENLKRLTQGAKVTVRMPIIPDYNANNEYMYKCGEMLKSCGVKCADLIPFHRMGSGKYAALGITYSYDGVKPPEKDVMESYAKIINNYGIDCRVEK